MMELPPYFVLDISVQVDWTTVVISGVVLVLFHRLVWVIK